MRLRVISTKPSSEMSNTCVRVLSRARTSRTVVATPVTPVMAPGEVVTYELEYVLPEDQLLGTCLIGTNLMVVTGTTLVTAAGWTGESPGG